MVNSRHKPNPMKMYFHREECILWKPVPFGQMGFISRFTLSMWLKS